MDEENKTYSFGIKSLDYLLEGMAPGELILLGSGHKAGRSTLGLHLAIYNALNNIPSAYYSFIYSQSQMQRKIYSLFSSGNIGKQITPTKQKILGQKAEKLNNAPLYLEVTENENRTGEKFLEKLTKEIDEKKLKLIVLDDLSMLFPIEKSLDSLEEEIDKLTKDLKNLAMRKKVLIFITIPINSDVSVSNDSNVTYARGLGFTSNLEMVSDRVLYLYRDYALKNNQRSVFIVKNKNKKRGTAILNFDEAKGCFLTT